MSRWVKRVEKERAGDLSGEQVLAACYFQGHGSTGAQLAFGLARGLASEVGISEAVADQRAAGIRDKWLRRSAGENVTPAGSLAAGFPDAKGVVAVTATRLFVFDYKQGVLSTKILDPATVIDLDQIEGWHYRSGRMASTLSLAFSDDSLIHLDLPMANKPDDFADRLQIPRDAED